MAFQFLYAKNAEKVKEASRINYAKNAEKVKEAYKSKISDFKDAFKRNYAVIKCLGVSLEETTTARL